MYKTRDLTLVAVLNLFRFKIEKVEKDGETVYFYFDDDEKEFKTTVDNYWAKNIEIEPIEFMSSVREVKSRIYNI